MILNIFPNPNQGEFTIEMQGEDLGKIEVRIYNITGTLIYNETGMDGENGFSSQIRLGEYQQGLYLIKVSYDHGSIVRKLLLNK